MLPKPAGSFRLFRLFGIDVYLHWLWFLLVAWEVSQVGTRYHSYPWAALEVLSVFVLVLMHEFGHALACRSVGGQADHIVLWLLGGVAYVAPPRRPGAVLWSVAAGPLVNVVLFPILLALVIGSGAPHAAAWTPFQWYLVSLLSIDVFLLLFNLLPIYPLDGGQILQSLLWFFIGEARSLRIVAIIGLVAAGFGGLLALWGRDMWLVILAFFIGSRAWYGYRVANALAAMEAAEKAHLAEIAHQWADMPPEQRANATSWSAPPQADEDRGPR